jgi:phage-related baseplate assembly protein
MEKAAREPILFRVNEEAIEKLRKRWDDAPNETAGMKYKTHTERRQAELSDYENTRPSTANIVVKPSKNGGQTDQDMFRKI